jgi:hypothetical protein
MFTLTPWKTVIIEESGNTLDNYDKVSVYGYLDPLEDGYQRKVRKHLRNHSFGF